MILNQSIFQINIRRVMFGSKTNKKEEAYFSKIALKIHPCIKSPPDHSPPSTISRLRRESIVHTWYIDPPLSKLKYSYAHPHSISELYNRASGFLCALFTNRVRMGIGIFEFSIIASLSAKPTQCFLQDSPSQFTWLH